jgi:predicted secreted Zn-dependent protease
LHARRPQSGLGLALARTILEGGGAGNRNRTYDLIITNDALYQLSYSGELGILVCREASGQFERQVTRRAEISTWGERSAGNGLQAWQLPFPFSVQPGLSTQMRNLVLILSLAAASSSAAEVNATLSYDHYDAPAKPGRSLAEILNDSSPFRPNGKVFHSATSWNVDWKFQSMTKPDGRCKIVRVDTQLSASIDLPRLIGADESTEQRFETYLSALRTHELGHYAIGREAAAAIDARLHAMPEMANCEALESAARDLGARTLGEYEAKGNQYDVETGHGRTQGAWLGD